MKSITLFCAFLSLCLGQTASPPFVIEPYLQMGNAPQLSASDSMVVMWHTADLDQPWDVQVKKSSDTKWSAPVTALYGKVAVRGIEPHRVYFAGLSKLKPGEEFDYRVRRMEQSVFQARARARKTNDQPYRFAVFGDCAAGTPEERAVAYQVYQVKPDF